LYDNKKETFEVKSDPVEFEMKIKPSLKKFKQSDMLIIMEYTGVYHLKLANYLYENDYKIAVINPFSIKRNFERFKSIKDASSFIGINPSPYESGTNVRKSGKIKKMGNPYARKILYMAALSVIRFNKYCRELYERLVNKGKAKKLALGCST
jgi:transposase